MNKAELIKLQAEIEADYRMERAAVQQLLKRWDEPRAARSKALIQAISSIEKRPSQCAEEIIKGLSETFTVSTLAMKMREAFGRKSPYYGDIARQTIHLLRQRGEVEAVVPGKGSRSGVYRYKGAASLA